jgi:NADPH2:quinone reductase
MRAAYYTCYGDPDVLALGELPPPEPGPGEVRIAVRAAGVNPVDWKLMSGAFAGVFPQEFPTIPGWDAAGQIDAVGAGVDASRVREPVFAYCRRPIVRGGTFAEFVVVPESFVARKPRSIDFAEAAALPLVALTAWQSLFGHAGLGKGQRVLIHAAAGGVGSLAVQMARHAGARVVATASPANADYVRSLGAHEVVDYRNGAAWTRLAHLAGDGFDVVFDTVGGDALARSYALVKPGGALPALNDAPDADACAARGIRGVRVFSEPDGVALGEIAAMIDAGALRVPAVEVLPLAAAGDALRRSMDGHVRGKLVLRVS